MFVFFGYVLFTRLNWSVGPEKEEGRKKIKKDILRKDRINNQACGRAVCPFGQILNEDENINLI